MALVTKTLFPPVIEHVMPAFLREGSCRVYFDLPVYNTIKDIQAVQIIVNNQNNNLSALKNEIYPNGIKMTDRITVEMSNGVEKYYVEIFPNDLEGGFVLNQYYKVQLRFVSSNVIMPLDNNFTSNWLAENQNGFSEWSSVCLIRGISTPKIDIKGLTLDDEDQSIVIASQTIDFIGKLTFSDNESDCLDNYNIKLYEDNDSNILIADSDIIYANSYAPNNINYTFRKELKDGENYKAIFSYNTKAGYSSNVQFHFSIILYDIEQMKVTIIATPEEELGRIKINVKSLSGEKFIGNLTIRRSDSRSNFTLWDDIYTDLISTGEVLDFVWYDNTIESGVWYNYCVQKRNARGDRGIITKIKSPVLCYFEDMFLVKENKLLKIKFDQQVSSWKRNLVESKTDTIGGKYPFIRRNANTDYRQFQISGLITRFMDNENEFTNSEDLYGTSVKLYNDFNEINKINKYNDFIYEREFRDKVMNFLHENDITLFKTLTEGNILVRLMDINITPNTTLGRRIYSFSATAYEIDELSIENFTKYNIQNAGQLNPLVQYNSTIIGRIGDSKSSFIKGEDIVQKIKNSVAEKSDAGFENIVQSLNYLRIEIPDTSEFKNRLINQSKGESLSYIISNFDIRRNDKLRRGTIVTINGKDFIIDESNYYEIFNAEIISLSFPSQTKAIIDYSCDIEKRESVQKLANRFYYFHKVGQLVNQFKPNEYLAQTLKLKYSIDVEDNYYQKLSSINGLTIWAAPNTVVYIKDSLDSKFNRFIIDESGVLDFNKEKATIEDFYFKGIHVTPKPNYREKPLITEYQNLYDTNGSTPDFVSVEKAEEWTAMILKARARRKIQKENPWLTEDEVNKKVNYLQIKNKLLNNTIYWIRTENENKPPERYICLDGKLYPCPGPNSIEDVEIPVDAIVNYYVDITKGEY